MEPGFWFQRWESNEIGFHKDQFHPLLISHFGELALPKGSRVFLPLCGKTRDITWLMASGYHVLGVELVEVAVQQLFEDLGMVPTVSSMGALRHYSAPDIDIWVGNVFDLTPARLGSVQAIYDRAALVALPQTMRQQYAQHLMDITGDAPQLIITFEYDQSLLNGPPFSIRETEIAQHYSDRYEIQLLERTQLPGGLKGQYPAQENVWLLQPRSTIRGTTSNPTDS